MSEQTYILYGNQPSYFAAKVRSYLRKKGIAFEERLTNHPHYLAVVAPKVGNNQTPVIETATGEVVQDTTEIIDFFEARYPDNPVYPAGAKQRLVSLLLELYGDEGLIRTALHYRYGFAEENRDYIVREFSRFMGGTEADMMEGAGGLDGMEQAKMVWPGMQEIIKGLGANAAGVPAIEASFEELLGLLEVHCQSYPYLLGGKPSIGDFSLFGSFFGHFTHDPYPLMLIKRRAPSVYRWVERMNVADAGMAEWPDMAKQYLPDDAIPETLLPILGLIARDYMPELESVLKFMHGWVQSHPDFPAGEPINPAGVMAMGAFEPLGQHSVMMRGAEVTQVVRYYSQWKYQRTLDHMASLSEQELADACEVLAPTGLQPYLQMPIPRRMERLNNREVFA